MTDHTHLAAEAEHKQRKRRTAQVELAVLAVLLIVGYAVASVYDLNEAWVAFAVRRWIDASSEARRVGELNRRVVQETAGHRQAAAAVRERGPPRQADRHHERRRHGD